MNFFFEDPLSCVVLGASDPMARDEESTIIKYDQSKHSFSFGLDIFFT